MKSSIGIADKGNRFVYQYGFTQSPWLRRKRSLHRQEAEINVLFIYIIKLYIVFNFPFCVSQLI